MQRIDQATQTVFADLNQRVQDATFDEDFPENGSFAKRTIKGKEYWYYSGYDPLSGLKTRKYVGPASDTAIVSRVEQFDRVKIALKTRLEAVRMLRAAGFPSPDGITGALVEKIAKAGFFRLRGVLVGTVAFQTYPGLIAARPERHLQTGDIDLAQDYGISIALAESIEPILGEIKEIDPTFREVPHSADSRRSTAFVNAKGYKVEFLVPNRGSDDNSGKPVVMPALGAAAQPLRFLDFLIRNPVRSVLLHAGGVSVSVPAPERYAIHKLIVATRRRDKEKRAKDIGQSGFLIEAMSALHAIEIADAWIEAWQRGPKWQESLTQGKAMLPADTVKMLDQVVTATAPKFGLNAQELGIERAPATS